MKYKKSDSLVKVSPGSLVTFIQSSVVIPLTHNKQPQTTQQHVVVSSGVSYLSYYYYN